MTRIVKASPTKPTKPRRRLRDRKSGHWVLQDAKARFSELIRRVRSEGPQHVTVHGRKAVVILSEEDYARLAPAASAPTLAALFGAGPFTRLDTFDPGSGRERPPVRDAIEF